MRHRNKKTILGRTAAPRKALLTNLAISLVKHGRITTSLTKAKTLRPIIERLITRGKHPTLANRRQLLRSLSNAGSVDKILKDLGPRFAARKGGYTRIIKIGRRTGDAGQTAMIEFV